MKRFFHSLFARKGDAMGASPEKKKQIPNDYCVDEEKWRRERPGIATRIGAGVKGAIGSVASLLRPKTPSPTFTPVRPGQRIVAAPTSSKIMPVPGTDERVAREILGNQSFLGIEEAVARFRLIPSATELEDYPGIPWSEKELYEARHTHVLVAGFRLSIADMLERTPEGVFYCERFGDWYRNHDFTVKEFVVARWYFLRKDAVPGSYNKTFLNGRKLLAANEELPRACELAYAMALHHMVTGLWLLRRKYVWCSDVYNNGYGLQQVFVGSGYGDEGCIIISSLYADTDADEDRGIAAHRRVPLRRRA